jgi:S1-C subfamily serine protease
MGIISGLGRTGFGSQLEDFIQTDASVNSGNSGGPLLDSRGRIVGVNTAIYSESGGNVGIAFAVPTTIVTAVIAQIKEHGAVRRGTIGVSMDDAPLELEGRRGAVVTDVEPESAAAEAGLETGDVLVAANGEPIDNAADVRRILGLLPPGSNVALDYYRAGSRRSLAVVVRPPEEVRVSLADGRVRAFEAEFTSIPSDHPSAPFLAGVAVSRVQQDGRLATLGVRAGDIVTQVNSTRVRSLEEFAAALEATEGQRTLVVARGNSLYPIAVN